MNRTDIELLEEELESVVKVGHYKSRNDLIRHALEVLLTANPALRMEVAVDLYRMGKITLARAAELAGLDRETFKTCLEDHGVSIWIDESVEDVHTGANLIHRLRKSK